ncbi:alpha/beta hydrolase [Oscillochloris sp. ZM17-4]|uniref:alpha/beta fold hydrolase n=1 Tax=Oscillochloris sp. ZM17-4 TaxID=2866714 RepID=UPI001C73976F|nr:alpha/beta hydrolase [Oscillochloris sp. ZM17-4]MBX0327341.1 alpha/beta hydrolase [Oscillochloris sp. ZM17-4]
MRNITYRGHTLTWEEHSQGDHTLIFIHGYSANRTIWTREVARMAGHGRCVTLDLPGHYPASAPPGYRALCQDDLLDLEINAIREIAGGGRVTMVGHSTGGMVALAAAAMLPEVVSRVIAISPVVWGPLAGFLGLYQRQMRIPGGYPLYWLNYRLTQLLPGYLRWGIGQFYSGDPAAYARNPVAAAAMPTWYPDYRRSQIGNFATLLGALAGCDIRPLAAQVACPSLVVAGARDPVVPIAQSRWLAQHLPRATLLEIPTSGHLPHWEAAEQVDAAVDGWLTDCRL